MKRHLAARRPGTNGTVIDVRSSPAKASSATSAPSRSSTTSSSASASDLNDQLRIVEADAFDRIEAAVGQDRGGQRRPEGITRGEIDGDYLASVEKVPLVRHPPGRNDVANQLETIKNSLDQTRHSFDLRFEEKRKKLTQGDELPPAC